MSRDGIDDPSVGRRPLLEAIGVGSAAALAGCFGNDVEEPSEPTDAGDAGGNGGSDGADASQSYDDVPVDELVDFPDDQCEVCAMRPANHPEWNAQLAHESGDRAFCCTPGCAVAYYVAPDAFDGPDESIASFWMTEFETGEFVDAFEATYVLEHETGHIDQPMGRNPYPFEDEGDALALVDEYGHLEEDDVVVLDEIDEEIAGDYRPGHF